MASTLFCDNIRCEVEEGNLVGAVYIDLSKAFDTIGHAILLNKLKLYGIKGRELDGFMIICSIDHKLLTLVIIVLVKSKSTVVCRKGPY